MTHICEYECMEVCVCIASRKTGECNCSVSGVVIDGETKRMLRCVQMYIDEDPANHLLKKPKTILI